MSSEPPELQVRDFGVHLGDVEVLTHLSFTVARGTTFAVIGPNGSGKTVLFRALVGALPHHGTVRWREGTRLGYVPQKLDLERDLPLTGADFLQAGAIVTGVPSERAGQFLHEVELSPTLASRPIGQLSGGQFQRLLIAFALLGEPTVLLLDEPLAGIDAAGQETLSRLLQRLKARYALTVLLISHDLSVVSRDADAVLCLGHRHCRVGPPREVLTPQSLRAIYGATVAYRAHTEEP